MKKISLLLILCCALFSFLLFTPSANASGALVKVVVSKSTIVYEDAKTSSKKLVTLSKGDYVTQQSSSKGWAKVKAGKVNGYVKLGTLQTKKFDRKIFSTRTELKQTASTNAKTVAAFQKGAIVQNYGSVGKGWSFVKVGKATGYVLTKNLKKPGTATKYVTYNTYLNELPNAAGDYTTTVKAYSKVTVLTSVGGYSYVKSGSKYGYLPASNLVSHVAFAKTYVPKCANVVTKTIKCKSIQNGGTSIYKNAGDTWEDYLGSYVVDGDDLYVGFYEGGIHLDFPLYKGKSWSYDFYIDDRQQITVLSVNTTVRYKGKTLKNVIKLENRSDYAGKYYTYLAPGYGYISIN